MLEKKTLRIIGERTNFSGFGRFRNAQIVALDSATLEPVVSVKWDYVGTNIVHFGCAFYDALPHEDLLITADGYKEVILKKCLAEKDDACKGYGISKSNW